MSSIQCWDLIDMERGVKISVKPKKKDAPVVSGYLMHAQPVGVGDDIQIFLDGIARPVYVRAKDMCTIMESEEIVA